MYSTAIIRGNMAIGASREAAESLAHLVISTLQQVYEFLGGSPMSHFTSSTPKEKAAVATAAQCASQRIVRHPNISTGVLNMQEQNTPIQPNLTNLTMVPAYVIV